MIDGNTVISTTAVSSTDDTTITIFMSVNVMNIIKIAMK